MRALLKTAKANFRCLVQTEEGQYRHHNNDQTDEPGGRYRSPALARRPRPREGDDILDHI